MKKFWIVLGHVCCLAAVLAAASAIVMLLWNWVVPSITGWAALKFWQAIVILVLAKILTGHGVPCKGHGGSHGQGHSGPRRGHLFGGCHKGPSPAVRKAMKRFREKLSSMSEEEREAFIKEKLESLEGNE